MAGKPKSTDTVHRLVPLMPKIPALSTISINPSASISDNEIERRYFQLFHEKLAIDLRCTFKIPTSFWTFLVPQAGHNEPAVRHAILALSALYKSEACKINTTEKNKEHLKFALVEYSKAVKSLRKTLSDGRPQIRLALISSLLFGCFESFHGNWELAIQHIYSGLNILKSLREEKRRKTTQSSALAAIDPELSVILGRLKLQILSFLALYPMCNHSFIDSEDEVVIEDVPVQFATLDEAFILSTGLATRIFQHLRRSARCRGPQDSLIRHQVSLTRLLDQWKKAYAPIIMEACQNSASREYVGALLLYTSILVFEIIVSTSISKEELIFDNFTEQFQRIIVFSRYILEKDQQIRGGDGLRVQQRGMGLTISLFYTATRCRNFSVRREAIAILRKWPCKDGIWDSLQAAKVAEWIVSTEEKRYDGDIFIPEECRVRMDSLKITVQNSGITVECIQGLVDGFFELRKINLL